MSWIQNLFSSHFIHALGWTLIHSLWQGAFLAILLAIALILLRKNSSKLRYFITISVLFTLIFASVITFVNLYQTPAPLSHYSSFTPKVEAVASVTLEHTTQAPDKLAFFSDYFGQHLPLIVTVWLSGVLVLMLRFLGGYALLQRMRHYQVTSVNREWQLKILEIADYLKIKKVVRLLESANAKTPMVIGYLKPVILLPLGTISGLSSKQIEVILIHEMAHIARNDYLINVSQSIVEIFLFFNPAMWWISGRVREEREHCCDDIVLQMTNDHLTLAKTLAVLEEIRPASLAVAFAGQKGGLLGRIRRIVNTPRINATFSEGFIAAILLVCFMFIGAFYIHASPTVEKNKLTVAKAVLPNLTSLAIPFVKNNKSTVVKASLPHPTSLSTSVKDTIRFDKFMIVINPRLGILVFKHGKIINPEDYDKYKNDFTINNGSITIGKKTTGTDPNTRKQNQRIAQHKPTKDIFRAILAKMKKDNLLKPDPYYHHHLKIKDGYIKINGYKLNQKQYEEYRKFIFQFDGHDITSPSTDMLSYNRK